MYSLCVEQAIALIFRLIGRFGGTMCLANQLKYINTSP